MRWFWSLGAGLMLATGLTGQENLAEKSVEGNLIEWEGSANSGELTVRAKDYHVYLFRFDGQTRFTRKDRPVSILDVRKGEFVEIFSDLGPGKPGSYASDVKLLNQAPARVAAAVAARRPRSYRSPLEDLFPRGSLTFSGVVVRLGGNKLVLRTRAGEEKTFLLRTDTRYLEDGSEVDRVALKVNTRVFVRAGKSLDEELEVYRVVWGTILLPR
jgi:hypothetical protein